MKKALLIAVLLLLHSCSLYKPMEQTNNNDDNLSETEKSIINDFLDEELKKERYQNYKNSEVVIIEESLKQMKSIETYRYSFNDWNSMIKSINMKM